jgi:hypothetical protein
LQTLEELARRIVRRRVATEGERRLAMRTAARSVDDPLMSTRGIAAMLDRSYRDMRDSGVRLSSVRLRRAPVDPARQHIEQHLVVEFAGDLETISNLITRDAGCGLAVINAVNLPVIKSAGL